MDVSKQMYEPVSTNGGLDESFIATATVVVTPCPPEAHAYLEVVAPATLPEVRSLILSPVFVLSCMNI
jgi:hypothetical protein